VKSFFIYSRTLLFRIKNLVESFPRTLVKCKMLLKLLRTFNLHFENLSIAVFLMYCIHLQDLKKIVHG
jgi:hypothetical protein